MPGRRGRSLLIGSALLTGLLTTVEEVRPQSAHATTFAAGAVTTPSAPTWAGSVAVSWSWKTSSSDEVAGMNSYEENGSFSGVLKSRSGFDCGGGCEGYTVVGGGSADTKQVSNQYWQCETTTTSVHHWANQRPSSASTDLFLLGDQGALSATTSQLALASADEVPHKTVDCNGDEQFSSAYLSYGLLGWGMSQTPLPDTDPNPAHLTGTVSWSKASQPTEQDWWSGYDSASYSMSYDLYRLDWRGWVAYEGAVGKPTTPTTFGEHTYDHVIGRYADTTLDFGNPGSSGVWTNPIAWWEKHRGDYWAVNGDGSCSRHIVRTSDATGNGTSLDVSPVWDGNFIGSTGDGGPLAASKSMSHYVASSGDVGATQTVTDHEGTCTSEPTVSTESRTPFLHGQHFGSRPDNVAAATLSADSYSYDPESKFQLDGLSVVTCMTRSDVDTDADGFPDAVDLDPTHAGTALALGAPTAPSAGVLPKCPAVPPSPTKECDGLVYNEVLQGPLPWGPSALANFPNDSTMCRGIFIPRMRFVPQGIALTSSTRAWVSGYENVSGDPCQLLQMNLTSGAVVTVVNRLKKGDYICKHGGGLAYAKGYLWVADTGRLWLVDPARIGTSNPVERTWKLEEPIHGSFLIDTATGQLGIGRWDGDKASKVHWFRYSDMLRDGVNRLVPQTADTGSHRARAVRTSSDPPGSQGAAHRPGVSQLWFTSSTAGCGMLVNGSTRKGFGPGAEEIAFDGQGGVWGVFEAGAAKYQLRTDKAPPELMPALVRFDVAKLLSGKGENCSW